MIEAVIFDIGGVLLTLGEDAYRAEVARGLGLPDLPEAYTEGIPRIQRGEKAEQDLWERISGRRVRLDAFDEAFVAHFRPVPAMWDLAASLRQQGLRTAILSNTCPSHVRLMRTMNFLDNFDPVAMSCEIGARKPEPEALQWVLNRLQLPPSQVAYVDDVPAYVEVGRTLGVRSIVHDGDVEATSAAIRSMMTK